MLDIVKVSAVTLAILSAFVSVTASSSCEVSWSRNPRTDFCYKYFSGRKSWVKAKRRCERDQSDLTSINNDSENDFLSDHVSMVSYSPTVWIGLNRQISSEWIDGTGVGYDNWAKGQPNVSYGNDYCAEFIVVGNDQGRWNAIDCDERRGYICKKRRTVSRIDESTDGSTETPNDRSESSSSSTLGFLGFLIFVVLAIIGAGRYAYRYIRGQRIRRRNAPRLPPSYGYERANRGVVLQAAVNRMTDGQGVGAGSYGREIDGNNYAAVVTIVGSRDIGGGAVVGGAVGGGAVVDGPVRGGVEGRGTSSQPHRTVVDESNDLAVVENLLEQHNKHLSKFSRHLRINRENIVQHVLGTYEDASLAESCVTVKMADERGMDGGGVTDDMYTTFWNRAQDMYFQGCDSVVPFLPINRLGGTEEGNYRILGRILSHTVALTKAFPLPLCKSACIVMVFNTTTVKEHTILLDFLLYLDEGDRNVVTTGINDFDSLTSEQIDAIQSIFARFEYPAVIRKNNFNEHLTKLARNIICIRPKPLLDLMREGIPQAHFDHFWSCLSIEYLEVMFRALRPNPERVIAAMTTTPAEAYLSQRQRRVFRFLTDFIKGLDQSELETFLHYITGKRTTPRQALVVCFTNESGFQRAPKAHTCSNMLELPETYENYETFKSEFKHLLATDEAMTMTMA